MKVKLIAKTDDPLSTMYTAARTCYSEFSSIDIYSELCYNENINNEKIINLIKKVLSSGHLSIAEHIKFTFAIEGISRSCSHQLVRHRLCTFSQQSQRYVNFKDAIFNYITPPSIKNNETLNEEYNLIMKQLKNFYNKAINSNINPEDARFVLPNAASTNIVMSTNLRNLMHLCNLRLCNRAQWEIKELTQLMVKEVLNQNKYLTECIKDFLQSSCEINGFCKEDKCCGRKPKLKDILTF